MVAPAVIAAGIMAASALATAYANWQESASGQKASKEERARISALVNNLQDPTFDTRKINPDDYKIAAKYIPEVADYVQEVNPKLVEAASQGATLGRQAQMRALDKYRQLSESGEDVQSQLLRQQALRDAAIASQGSAGAIQQSMARRGIGGSGLELVSSLLAQQEGARRGQEGAERAALDAYNHKLEALKNSASLGGDVYNQDVSLEAKNAGVINDYNQRQAAARQNWLNQGANTRNDANYKNVGLQNEITNKNIAQRNASNQDYQNMKNDLAQRTYQNAANKVGLQTGQGQAAINDIRAGAQDRISAINGASQGLASIGNAYIQGSNSEDAEDRKQKNLDRDYALRAYEAKYGK